MLTTSFTIFILLLRLCVAQESFEYPPCILECVSSLTPAFCQTANNTINCLCTNGGFLAAWTNCAKTSGCSQNDQESGWRAFVATCQNTGSNLVNSKPRGFGNDNSTVGDPRQQEQSPPVDVIQEEPSQIPDSSDNEDTTPTEDSDEPSITENASSGNISLGIASTLPDALNSLPTGLPKACSGADWDPSPENWQTENVDRKLAQWWSSEEDNGKFVETLFKSFGDKSGGVQCGIGFIETCPMPSCESFRTAKDPKWAYFAQVAVVRMNTLFNQVYTAISYGQLDFNSVIPHLVTLFKPYKDPRTKLQKAMPFVTIAIEGIVGAIPFVGPTAGTGARRLVAESGKLLAEGGAKVFSAEVAKKNVDPSVQRDGNIEELGLRIKEISDLARTTLEDWVSLLFSGAADASGSTLLKYLTGGAHTLPLRFTLQDITTFYTNIQVSKVWNDQVRNNTVTFVMCGNSKSPTNADIEFYDSTLKKRCKLFRVDDNSGDFVDLFGIDCLKEFDIKASDIAASSLRTYQSSKFTTSDDQVAFEQSLATAYASTSSGPEDESAAQQPLNQGMKFGGIFNMPVCDLGDKEDWLSDGNYPCCCGPDCQEQADFMEAARMGGWGKVIDRCKSQYSGWEKVDYGSGAPSLLSYGKYWIETLWTATIAVVLSQLI